MNDFSFHNPTRIEFGSGKDPEFVRERVAKSPGLSPEQQATLEARGYLSPDEIHKLAQATAGVVAASGKDKADCHSDYVDPDAAKRLDRRAHAAETRSAKAEGHGQRPKIAPATAWRRGDFSRPRTPVGGMSVIGAWRATEVAPCPPPKFKPHP